MYSFEVLTEFLLEIEAFMEGTPCRLVNSHRRFGGSYCIRRHRLAVQAFWVCWTFNNCVLESYDLGKICVMHLGYKHSGLITFFAVCPAVS
jgi:hypothetical protein